MRPVLVSCESSALTPVRRLRSISYSGEFGQDPNVPEKSRSHVPLLEAYFLLEPLHYRNEYAYVREGRRRGQIPPYPLEYGRLLYQLVPVSVTAAYVEAHQGWSGPL